MEDLFSGDFGPSTQRDARRPWARCPRCHGPLEVREHRHKLLRLPVDLQGRFRPGSADDEGEFWRTLDVVCQSCGEQAPFEVDPRRGTIRPLAEPPHSVPSSGA